MLDRRLRPLQAIVYRPFLGVALTPNQVTALACVVGLGCAMAAWLGGFRVALLLWLLNRFLDGLDGALARATGRQTDLGGYLDLTLDFLVYAAVPAGIAAHLDTASAYRSVAGLLGAFYVNAAAWMVLSAILERRRATREDTLTSIRMPPGIIGGTETAVFY
ncbi:MAG: CDP-alcohol phosphatidyltransferase family protein, partial [Candidatus Eremiobacterota bacterium]